MWPTFDIEISQLTDAEILELLEDGLLTMNEKLFELAVSRTRIDKKNVPVIRRILVDNENRKAVLKETGKSNSWLTGAIKSVRRQYVAILKEYGLKSRNFVYHENDEPMLESWESKTIKAHVPETAAKRAPRKRAAAGSGKSTRRGKAKA